jgi:ferredoxin
MAKLIFVNNEKEFVLEDGVNITDACEKAGIPFACGGEGICGSCLVEVIEGMKNLSPPTEAEKDFLGEDVSKQRLACQCRILKNTVKLKF